MEASDSKVTAPAPTTRTVPMKVLCLGMGRTGTISLRESLLTLGYRHSYHTMDAVTGKFYDCKLWTDLLKKKESGKKVTREDFDRILGDSQAVLDMPAAYFAEELIEAYPDAKIILTVRDTESWFTSTRRALRPLHESYLTRVVSVTENLLLMPTRHLHPLFRSLDRLQYNYDFDTNGRRVYEEHNDRVRALAPPDRFLEYHVREGWGAAGKRVLDIAAYAALVTVVAGAAANRWGFKWPSLCEEAPQNIWKIVLMDKDEDGAAREAFKKMGASPYLRAFNEIYIRDVLGVKLERKE
ncbi:hypothetical protein NLG97_g9901 [Lecanicillium saksenae]|uniref:Uncharacterized protein n=1 Tax=Lecanicillium saksenae TaxID=468837 RepID=A0ACC1QEP7_9HYPO|nr:hypothetical protein NLG97_g9901 [Lecanicillium saksenae]